MFYLKLGSYFLVFERKMEALVTVYCYVLAYKPGAEHQFFVSLLENVELNFLQPQTVKWFQPPSC